MGDLRWLRITILHHGGVLKPPSFAKLVVLKELFQSGQPLALSYDKMHTIFARIKGGIAELFCRELGLPQPPGDSPIVGFAIQRT